MTQTQMSTGIRSSGLSRRTLMAGGAGHLAALLLLLLALVVLASGCAVQSNPGALSAADAQTTMHRVHVVRHGWHSGIVVRAADVPEHAWPARREFIGAEHLEVGWGDRAYYPAPDPSVWLGLRALLWPTAGVLHMVAFSGPVEHYFASAEIVALQITPQGFAQMVAAISASHELDAAGQPIPLGPGLYSTSRFYASREAFHLFATCNVWVAAMLREAGVPISPTLSPTSDALFAKLRRQGQVIRPPPPEEVKELGSGPSFPSEAIENEPKQAANQNIHASHADEQGVSMKGDSSEAVGGLAPPPWHVLSADDVVMRTDTGPDGLTHADAAERLKTHGPNVIPRGKGDTALDLIWRQINSPLIWVLIVSALVAMLVDPTGGIKNGLVILAVVVLNTIIGFVQEFKAGKAIEALSLMVPENVSALREGRKLTLPAANLVPGDVVLLASGDKVPADMRLIQMRSLQIEEAALTGESVPTEKHLAPVAAESGIGDRRCMVFGGTLVTYGTGTAVVVETGARTELGRISTMLRETTDLQTPLTKALAKIGLYITVAITLIALAMLVLGTWRAMSETGVAWLPALRESVIFAVALAVGAIPEGLPAIVTIALAIGVQRMAARRAVVRKLPAVETLGSTTVICSDKTGTLTRNEMTVQEIWTPVSGGVAVSGVGYAPKGELLRSGTPASPVPAEITDLLLAGALCNDASLTNDAGQWKIHGDPTEGALVVAAAKIALDVEQARAQHKRLDAIPFESENQFMATLHAQDGGRILLKGAPEAVLKRCLTAPDGMLDTAGVLREVEALAARGMRVLAFAAKPAHGQTGIEMHDTQSGFTLLGLQGMIDPPRPEAIAAIKLCHQAGITVKMITGDHQGTAQAIAGQLGILPRQPGAPQAITGAQLAAMSEAQLRDAASACNVFARVAPEHKLSLVRALQSRNEVVAMTGDGVNDAPALKQANIGVAMGITGTSVTKEVAGIVLADDNFASIAAAVEEGRRVYDNLIKSLAFVLPTNLGLALILMWAVAFFPFVDVTYVISGVTHTVRELLLPMAPAQLLWINLVAAVALALPLAFDAKEPDIMSRPPRGPGAPVLSGFIVMRTFVVAILMTAGAIGLFLYEFEVAGAGGPEALAKAQTMAVTTVIMFQIFYLLNCRSLRDSVWKIGLFSNKTVFAGIAAILALQTIFIYAPFMHAIFDSAPLAPGDVLASILVGAVILPVVGLEKWWRRRRTVAEKHDSHMQRDQQ